MNDVLAGTKDWNKGGSMKRFALIGVGGYIARRHLQAIKDVGGDLVAAVDPHDSVGIIDSYFPDAEYFTEIERFERHIGKLKMAGRPVDYVVVCTPNYLHDSHIRLGLNAGADVICEKPMVINARNLEQIAEVERSTGRRVWTVLQLRLHPEMIRLKDRLAFVDGVEHDVRLVYVTPRGNWYHNSWKGDEERSGGLAMNIGIHMFDLMQWLFGGYVTGRIFMDAPARMWGAVRLERALVNWRLSVHRSDLAEYVPEMNRPYRVITVDGQEFHFSEGFADLHTRVYEEVIDGRGFGIEDARPSIELVSRIIGKEQV